MIRRPQRSAPIGERPHWIRARRPARFAARGRPGRVTSLARLRDPLAWAPELLRIAASDSPEDLGKNWVRSIGHPHDEVDGGLHQAHEDPREHLGLPLLVGARRQP